MTIKKLILGTFIILLSGYSRAQVSEPPFLKYLNHPWVDSVMKTLTPAEKIAQSVWIAAWSGKSFEDEVAVAETIKNFGIGGLVFFQGRAENQAELTNYYQKISKVPLFIATDAEWGAGMRLADVLKFPYQMTLGAIKNDSLIYELGKAVGLQCKDLGVGVNLAPVSDINNNPFNPVINYRSFGENRENVARKAVQYMKGLQDMGILATAKHFPGHGDTGTDSHLDLPVINISAQRLDSLELYPFTKLIDEGSACIMTAHINLPAIDSGRNIPSSLSPEVINKLLLGKMGFRGLVITDAMNMKGITKYYPGGEAEAMAYLAGNDIIEYVTDPAAAVSKISGLLNSKKITADLIDAKCRKILAAKYFTGLGHFHPLLLNNISEKLNSADNRSLITDLYANALTLLKNSDNIIPLRDLPSLKIATVAVGKKELTTFQSRLCDYMQADNYFADPADSAACHSLIKDLKGYNLIIAGVYGLDQRPDRNFGVRPELDTLLQQITSTGKSIIVWFGNPYGVGKISSFARTNGLLLAYQENDYTGDLSAQLIFGGIGANGSLPVTISKEWPSGWGIQTAGNLRLQYALPENAGVSTERLENKIDSIANSGIEKKAYPGCEVMVARKGKIIFRKCYGFQDYDERIPVRDGDLFDLASVTKISATIPSLMILEGEGRFSTDETLGHYLPYFRKSDKGKLLMRDILAHQAGLKAWIPYWKETVNKDGKFKKHIYSTAYSPKYDLQVAEGLYITDKYIDRIHRDIKRSPLTEKKYLYSDLGFILAPEIIRNLSGKSLPEFVGEKVYSRIGAGDIVYNPLTKYHLSRIIPTEYDSLFRKQLLHGTVHDEGAAMMGGVSGHAGLFATANDMMKLMETYRRMGNYGGEQVIPQEILKKYTSVQFPENGNRRGLGFDKPLLNNSKMPEKDAYPAIGASPSSFGHSGYTGTFVWVDPEKEISYVFLTNRVNPTRNNNLIIDLNIRSGILQAIYDSIIK